MGDTNSFSFNTLRNQSTRQTMPIAPKAIHDEMNATNFDEYGRMQANLGIENGSPQPGAVNATLLPFVNPQTELIDGTDLPKYDPNTKVTPIANLGDGTQIWRITHNGVDTHPIHFHLYDVQVLNRVPWDGQVTWPEPNELGWKDTVRVSPLEDTIVALRPVIPKLPWEIPNSVRPLNPMMPLGSTDMFNQVDLAGNALANAITNRLVNFGWEYVYHCHILSHEEMDMMRPVSLALPPAKPDGLARTVDQATGVITLSWNDNSISETSFVLQRSTDGTTWSDVGRLDSPLDQTNTHGVRSLVDSTADPTVDYQYRVVANNTVGYIGGSYPTMTAQSVSDILSATKPPAPTGLTATQDFTAPGNLGVKLQWVDRAGNEQGYVVERSMDNGASWLPIGQPLPPDTQSFTDLNIARGVTYSYRAVAFNDYGRASSNVASITLVQPPNNLVATVQSPTSVRLTWTDSSTVETGYQVQRSTGGNWTTLITLGEVPGIGSVDAYVDTSVPLGVNVTWRVLAVKGADSAPSNVVGVNLVAAPTGLKAAPAANGAVSLTWNNNSTNETGFYVRRSTDAGATWTMLAGPSNALAPNSTAYLDTTAPRGRTYAYEVGAVNAYGIAWSNSVNTTIVATPTGLVAVVNAGPVVALTWTDNAINESAYRVQRSSDNGTTWTQVGADQAANTQAYGDTTAVDGATYTYRVGAVDGPDIAWSATVKVTILSAPTDLRAALRTNPAGVRLTWTDKSASETGYSIQRSDDGGLTWGQIATRAAVAGTGNVVSYTDSSALLGTAYLYRVAPTKVGAIAYSNVVAILFGTPPAPTSLTGKATSTSTRQERIVITWSDVPNETGYRVQWSPDKVTIRGSASKGANVTTHTVTGLPKQIWYVRVQASNALGAGPWSDWVAVPSA